MAGTRGDAGRTSNACHACREKKVKCSGEQPCRYCSSKHLPCVFSRVEKRRLVAESQIRELQDRLASYEQHNEGVQPDASPPTSVPRTIVSQTQTYRSSAAIAPGTTLSSSETFGTEVTTVLEPSNSCSTVFPLAESANSRVQAEAPELQAFFSIPGWPSEDEVDILLELVVLNIGISQQLFDARVISDRMDRLYQNSGTSELWGAELCLIFAVGRLLQAREDVGGHLPGTALFREATRRTPLLTEIRKHGILGIEIMALTALYLQIVDRKEDAYLHSSTALRLAISLRLHQKESKNGRSRSEMVQCNRLWWSLYMQERRLCAASGLPMSIEDYAITVSPPHDAIGHPPATALAVNVRTARVTGQITSAIYSHKDEDESVFVANVQAILHSLHDIENTMPSEYSMDVRKPELIVSGQPFADVPAVTARTSSSLYISVYTAIIYAVRPVLLYIARNARNHHLLQSTISPALRRIAEICVEAASKNLVILQALKKRNLLAKHAFLDLDALFSASFVFVLVEAVDPGKRLGSEGIDGCQSILRYLAELGNRAAATRLAELNKMCQNLTLQAQQPRNEAVAEPSPLNAVTMGTLLQPFSFVNGFHNSDLTEAQDTITGIQGSPTKRNHNEEGVTFELGDHGYLGLNVADLADIPLGNTDDLYGVYHTSDMPLTGVEQTDWEALGTQAFWGSDT